MEHEALTHRVIGCAMRVHRTLRPGYLESVYRNALAWELGRESLAVECERRLLVRYREALVGEFVADMVVGGVVRIEIKAVRTFVPAHEAQLVNYLMATRMTVGLLVHFGAERLAWRRRGLAAVAEDVGLGKGGGRQYGRIRADQGG